MLTIKDVLINEVLKGVASLHEINDKERIHLQKVLVGMLLDVQKACKQINIEFALCGGSTLGAVRHKGFIPWDDDVDILMFRDDWNVFKQHFKELLGDKYEMEAPNYGNKDTKYVLPKIYLKGTKFVEIQEVNMPFYNGIFIDVFIIDNISDNIVKRKIDGFICDFIKGISTSIVLYKYQSKEMKQFMNSSLFTATYYRLRLLLGFLCSCISHKNWCSWFDRFVSRYPNTTRMTTVPAGLKGYKGEMMERNIWKPFVKEKFEEGIFNIPFKYHEYLTRIYGDDYMELPPIEKRKKHIIMELSFGK